MQAGPHSPFILQQNLVMDAPANNTATRENRPTHGAPKSFHPQPCVSTGHRMSEQGQTRDLEYILGKHSLEDALAGIQHPASKPRQLPGDHKGPVS